MISGSSDDASLCILPAGKRPEKIKLGTLRIDVADVVRNKKLSDTWPLQETETGELQLKLEWLAVEVDDV